MNVLVYSGPGVIQSSLSSVIASLQSLLVPNYTVQPLTHQALISHPWSPTCALLVLPACHSISSTNSIKTYVENGGSVLAFSVGARSSRGNLTPSFSSLTISEGGPLHLRSGTTSEYVSIDFQPGDSEKVSLKSESDAGIIEGVPCHSPRPSYEQSGTRVIGKFADDGIAGIKYSLGAGSAVLWAPHLEHVLHGDAEKSRLQILGTSLRECGLHIPIHATRNTLLPQFLVGPASVVSHVLTELSAESLSKVFVFEDKYDTFHLHPSAAATSLLEDTQDTDPSTRQPKHIIVYADGSLPRRDQTPLFDIELYFKELSKTEEDQSAGSKWRVGEALLYGKTVTSTQSMLEKNPRLLSLLPTPFLSLASHQLQGRGRGSNVWLSPPGCLLFSLLLRVSLSSLPASKLVFVQYLFGLAVTEACRSTYVLGTVGDNVRLKWPNDLYAVLKGEKKKVGGILVNTNFSGETVEIIIGCGLNVLNPAPIASLSQLVASDDQLNLRVERTAAAIMAKFESMWNTFIAHRGSFEPFMDLYLRRWLHSNEIVTLTTTTPERKVRITGITCEYGLLRTIPERGGWDSGKDEGFIDLQPDGNSFDIMAGLIKSKS